MHVVGSKQRHPLTKMKPRGVQHFYDSNSCHHDLIHTLIGLAKVPPTPLPEDISGASKVFQPYQKGDHSYRIFCAKNLMSDPKAHPVLCLNSARYWVECMLRPAFISESYAPRVSFSDGRLHASKSRRPPSLSWQKKREKPFPGPEAFSIHGIFIRGRRRISAPKKLRASAYLPGCWSSAKEIMAAVGAFG